jgi:hypothetical protein
MKKRILALLLVLFMAGNVWAATDTFTITTDSFDQRILKTGTSYPPSAVGPTMSDGACTVKKDYYGGTYYNQIVVLKFDTSSIPDNATITGATLYPHLTNRTNNDSRNLNCEWYEWSDATAYADTVGTTGFSVNLNDFTMNQSNNISLSNPTNVSKTGYTYFRVGISGDAPASDDHFNEINIRAVSDGVGAACQMTVTYTIPAPPGIPGNPTFSNVANKAMTISWTAATGATSYTLQRGGSNISTNATSPYNDSGLSVATSYTYRVIAVNADGSTNCAADQSQTTTYWSKKMNGSTVKKINGSYVDKVNGL